MNNLFSNTLYLPNNYKTIASIATSEIKEKGSKFLGYADAVFNDSQIKQFLNTIKENHPKATHHCYAYRLGFDKNVNYRSNDDGEPSGTAGKPILGQIDSKQLSNVMIIVVRYFGGTMLGVSGLIDAYKSSAKITLENAQIITKQIMNCYEIKFNYLQTNTVMRFIKSQNNCEIITQQFDEECKIILALPKEQNQNLHFFNDMQDIHIDFLYSK